MVLSTYLPTYLLDRDVVIQTLPSIPTHTYPQANASFLPSFLPLALTNYTYLHGLIHLTYHTILTCMMPDPPCGSGLKACQLHAVPCRRTSKALCLFVSLGFFVVVVLPSWIIASSSVVVASSPSSTNITSSLYPKLYGASMTWHCSVRLATSEFKSQLASM